MGMTQVNKQFYLTKASNAFTKSKAANTFSLTMAKPDLPPIKRIMVLPGGEFLIDSDGNYIIYL